MLDLPITKKLDVQPQVTETTVTRVRRVVFDFDNTTAVAFLSFGNNDADGNFVPQMRERWTLSGNYYLTQISQPTSSAPVAEELLGRVAAIVTEIQSDDTKRQALEDSGELVIG